MIDFYNFKNTIELLEKNNIRFWVFGGFALDGMRGKITREHGDIDIYLDSDDLTKLKNIFSSKEYNFYKREKMYFVESSELKLGIVILTKENDLIIANGNKTIAKYPKEFFSKNTNVSIDSFTFRIVPFEILFLESNFSRFEKDKLFGQKIKINQKLYNKIETMKIRD
jgi:phosphorylcholine metabolism protein LicD